MFLMINQIPFGKATHGKMQCGWATRHKDVRLCAVGALAFCAPFRFRCFGEFADMTLHDWKNNKEWFDVKLLSDIAGDNKHKMTSDSHRDCVKAILKGMNLPCHDLPHPGCKLGSKIPDWLEEETKEILRMGQWADGTWDGAHSLKLPLAPIRKLAGFIGSKICFNARTAVEADEELLRLTPIGEWCCDAKEEVGEACLSLNVTGQCQTAYRFLCFICKVNRVFIQDAAAMVTLHPTRCEHPMFHELPVFATDPWQASMFVHSVEVHRISI